MRLLVSGATLAVRKWFQLRPDRIGTLLTPGKGMAMSMVRAGIPFAADNGCFTRFDKPAILRMLDVLQRTTSKPFFVAAPDVVADCAATMDRFKIWGPLIRSMGLSVALVGQDGLTPSLTPWRDLDGYFVGGSTEWKESRESRILVETAKEYGKHVHMGRVNSFRRIKLAVSWGCDSIDGTGFTWFSDQRIPFGIRWIDQSIADAALPRLFA